MSIVGFKAFVIGCAVPVKKSYTGNIEPCACDYAYTSLQAQLHPQIHASVVKSLDLHIYSFFYTYIK